MLLAELDGVEHVLCKRLKVSAVFADEVALDLEALTLRDAMRMVPHLAALAHYHAFEVRMGWFSTNAEAAMVALV